MPNLTGDSSPCNVAAQLRRHLDSCYQPGFGICPTSVGDNFGNQLWARDFALTTVTYWAKHNPHAAIESLTRLLDNQRKDGALPYRVVREYGFFRIVPQLAWLARPAFVLRHGNGELASFEGQENGAEDTVPAIIIAAAAIFGSSAEGRTSIESNFDKLVRAMEYVIRTKTDGGGLIDVTRSNPDWTETIQRKGVLGYINVLWVQALRLMAHLARRLGRRAEAARYLGQYRWARESLILDLYDDNGDYFRAKAGDDRLDTAATVLGALFFLSAEQCWKVLQTLDVCVRRASGLANFYPPYFSEEIWWIPRLFGNGDYHNELVWPWLTCLAILLELKVASGLKVEHDWEGTMSWAELSRVAMLYRQCDGAPEVVEPSESKIAKRTPFYNPPIMFAPSCATFVAAAEQMGCT